MFRQRLLTTLVLVPLVLFLIYYANSWIFTGLITLLMVACGWEWLSLIPIKSLWLKITFILVLLVTVWLNQFHFYYWLLTGIVLWVAILIAVLSFPKSQRIWGYRWVVFIAAIILLPLFAQSMLRIYYSYQGKNLIVYLLFLVWAADIGAYLVGKQWGKHKLIPIVSPGKTVEGGLSGFILALLVALGGYFYFQPKLIVNWFLIAIATALISVLGDLFISMLKRRTNIKDTGHLLPGHGGVLDRLDSLIAASPLFYCGLFFRPGIINMVATLFYFFLALLLLITVHEYGHFLVARLCGVKVLRFSFGFGKVLARWHDKQGTEYAWSLFPLGGYVKMLDENEGEVPVSERHMAFNNKSIWARIAIIVAGPIFNFIFAFVALWLVLVIGIQSLAPMIDGIKPGSIAASAGLEPKQEILALGNKNISSWRDFQFALMPLLGSDKTISLTVKSLKNGQKKTVVLALANWEIDPKKPDPLDSLGIKPFIPTIPPIIGEVVNNTPAKNAGLEPGDVIKQMNNKPMEDWLNLVEYVRLHADEQLSLAISRQGQNKTVNLQIGAKLVDGQKEGFLGLRSQKVDWPQQWLRTQRQGPIQAIDTAFIQTTELTSATFSLIGRFIVGKLALQSISGPVGIAQGAGESARSGFTYYLSFLALVSISLGVLNLLPIPMLDGGHLLYCLIEIIRGRPLSDNVKSVGIYLGLVLLMGLMLIALSNDISRLTN